MLINGNIIKMSLHDVLSVIVNLKINKIQFTYFKTVCDYIIVVYEIDNKEFYLPRLDERF